MKLFFYDPLFSTTKKLKNIIKEKFKLYKNILIIRTFLNYLNIKV